MVPVLPHPSVALQVLITVLVQPGAPVSAPSVKVAINPVEQLSFTVGGATAASICACVGLHGIAPMVPNTKVGTCVSMILVTAADSLQLAIVLVAPAAVEPHAEVK